MRRLHGLEIMSTIPAYPDFTKGRYFSESRGAAARPARLMFLAIDPRLHQEGNVPPSEQRKTGEPAQCREIDPVCVTGGINLRCNNAQRECQHHDPQAQLVERIEGHLPAGVPLRYPD